MLKVLVAKSPVEGLHANLKSIVEGLLKWPEGTKNLFKAKVCFKYLSCSMLFGRHTILVVYIYNIY